MPILSTVKQWFAAKHRYLFHDRGLQLLLDDWEYNVDAPSPEQCKFCEN